MQEVPPNPQIRQDNVVEFIETVSKKLNLEKSQVYTTEKGRYGGTFAHWKLGLAYAAFLNPEIHSWFMEVAREKFGRGADPDLIL